MIKQLFLDTSAQAVRIFYPDEHKSQLLDLIQQSEKVSIALFSRYEFFHTWYKDLGRIYNVASMYENMSDVLFRLSHNFNPSNNILIILSKLTGSEPRALNEPKVVAEQAEMWIEYMLDIHYSHLPFDKTLDEIDIIGCSMLSDVYSKHKWINENGSFEGPKPSTCSKNKAKCTLHKLVKHNIEELKKASETLNVNNRDKKFVDKVKEIVEKSEDPRGRYNCARISDWTLIKHAPLDSEIASMDQDWVLICSNYGFKVHKIVVNHSPDKEKTKQSMSA